MIASGASFLVCSIARAVYIMVRTSFRKCTLFLNSEYNFQFYRRVSLTCNKTACGGICEPNDVAFSSCERSELPSLFNARAVYIYIIERASFRKCISFLNSEYNFQFYWRVINLQQYRVRRNPRAQRCSVF